MMQYEHHFFMTSLRELIKLEGVCLKLVESLCILKCPLGIFFFCKGIEYYLELKRGFALHASVEKLRLSFDNV